MSDPTEPHALCSHFILTAVMSSSSNSSVSSHVRLRASNPDPEPFVTEAIDVDSSFSVNVRPGLLARSLGMSDIQGTVTQSVDKFQKATTTLASALKEAATAAKEGTDGLRDDLATVLPTLTDFADRISTAAEDANVNASNINSTLLAGIGSINSMFARLTEPTGPIASLLRFFVSTGMLLIQLFGESSSAVKIASISAYLVNLPFVAAGTIALLKDGFEFIIDQINPGPLIDPEEYVAEYNGLEEEARFARDYPNGIADELARRFPNGVDEEVAARMMMYTRSDTATDGKSSLFRGLVGVLSSLLGFRADTKETIEKARSINTNLGVVRSMHAVIKLVVESFKSAFSFVAELFSTEKAKLRQLYEEIEIWKEMTLLFDIGGALYMVASDCSYANIIISHEAYGRELESKCKLFSHEDRTHQQTLMEMKMRLDVLKPIKEAAIKARHLNQDRPEPIIMYIYGEPGIGKSSAVDSIAAYFYTLLHGKIFKKATDMFTFNSKDAYFSGYSNQAVVFIDDMFQMKNKEATQKAVEFIFKAKGDHQQPLEMAEIEKKGTTILTSQLIICTSNTPIPAHATNEVSNPEALRRRFDFMIEMTIASEFRLPGSLTQVDPTKVLPKFGHAGFNVTEVSTASKAMTFEVMLKVVVTRYAKLQHAVANKRAAADEISREMMAVRDGPEENWADAEEIQWANDSIIHTVRSGPGAMYIGGGCYFYHDKKCYTLADLPEGTAFGEKALCEVVEVSIADVIAQPHQVDGPYKMTIPVKVGKPFRCTHARHAAAFIPMFVGGTSYESSTPRPLDHSIYAGIRSVFLTLKAAFLKGVVISKKLIDSVVEQLGPISSKVVEYIEFGLINSMQMSSSIWKSVKTFVASICSLETALKVIASIVGVLSFVALALSSYFITKKVVSKMIGPATPPQTAMMAGSSGDPSSRNRIVTRPSRTHVMGAGPSGDPTSANRPVPRPPRASAMTACRQDPLIKKDGVYQSLAATGQFCQEPTESAEMMFTKADINAHSMAIGAMHKNVAGISASYFIGDNSYTSTMNAVGVCGRLMITNNHLIPPAATGVQITIQKYGGSEYFFDTPDFHIIHAKPGFDFMAIYFPRMLTQFPDIRRQFLTWGDHQRMRWGGNAMLVGCRQRGGALGHAISYVSRIRGVRGRQTTLDDGSVEEFKNLVVFDTAMWNGSCGSLMAIDQVDMIAKFIGIMATSNEIESCAAIIYREDIEQFMVAAEQFHPTTRSLESKDCPVINPKFIPIEEKSELMMTTMGNHMEGFEICGRIDPLIVARAATKSTIVESLLYEACEPTTRRARLTIHTITNADGTTTRRFPQDGSISKQKAPPVAYKWHEDDVEYVTQNILNGYTTRRSPHDRDYMPLTDAENINGRPGCKDFTSIVTSTSAGMPFNAVTHIEGTPREPGKKSFFKGQPGAQYMSPVLDSMVSQLEETCATHVPVTIATIVNKDERRPPHKADNPRTISTLAVDVVYLMRRYFIRFISHVNYMHNSGEVKIGINAFSPEWEELFNRMTRNSDGGKNTFGFDYSSYDKQLPKQLTDAAIDMINQWYYVCFQRKLDDDMSEYFHEYPNATDEEYFNARIAHRESLEAEFVRHQQIRRNLWYSISECYYANGDVVYRTCFGNPSGNPMTTHMNSIVNQMLVRLAYIGCVDAYRYPFEENVELAVFGDDAIVAVSNAVRPNFNFFKCKEMMAESGIKITWPSKDEVDEEEFSRIENLSFLKRGFKMNQEFGRIVGPMDEDVIYETPLWIRTGMDPSEATVGNYENSLREAALHGRAFFDNFKATYSAEANKIGLKIPQPTYLMVLTEFFKGW